MARTNMHELDACMNFMIYSSPLSAHYGAQKYIRACCVLRYRKPLSRHFFDETEGWEWLIAACIVALDPEISSVKPRIRYHTNTIDIIRNRIGNCCLSH